MLIFLLFLQMIANVTLGFVKDARFHIDVQGFNVYHKNRLIKVCCLCLLYQFVAFIPWSRYYQFVA